MIACPTPLTRAQRDFLAIVSFRWPHPCYVVSAGSGRCALVVTEMTAERTLARLRGFAGPTVAGLQNRSLVTPGVVIPADQWIAVPSYSGARRGDSFRGFRVSITDAGCAAIGAPTVTQRHLKVMADVSEQTRGMPEGTVDAEIRKLRDARGEALDVEAGLREVLRDDH